MTLILDYWTEIDTEIDVTLLKQQFGINGQAFFCQIVTIEKTWLKDFEPKLNCSQMRRKIHHF